METYEHNGRHYPPYVPPSDEKLLRLHAKAENAFVCAFKELGLNPTEYYVDFHLLNNAFIRTDQRELHYLMYHRGMKMNELKRIAVFSYWVLRLKPVHRLAGGPININEQIIVDWLLKSANLYRSKKGMPPVEFSNKLKKDLIYAATYRGISYDYMTMLIDGLAA